MMTLVMNKARILYLTSCYYIYLINIGDPTKTKVKFKCRDTCSKWLPRLCGGETSSPSITLSMKEPVPTAPSSSSSMKSKGKGKGKKM